jgi:ppGpp synthetase/RelA/SpoT-type nucleotidyltranferase
VSTVSVAETTWREEYNRRFKPYERLKDELEYVLKSSLAAAGISIHTSSGRIKSWESFLQKARTKAEEGNNPFDTIHDLCGLRIVTLFHSDLDRIGELVHKNLTVVSSEDKLSSTPVETFGYMDRQYLVMLPETFRGPRYDDLKALSAELQVRTIGMDAWASVSHYLDYKSAYGVPSALRRDFYALSALFYVADQHFEMLFRAREETRAKATKDAGSAQNLIDQEINLDTLTALLRERYKDREHSSPGDMSELLGELHAAGYKNIQGFRKDLERFQHAADEYEKKHPPGGTRRRRFTDIGIVRMALDIGNTAYREARRAKGQRFYDEDILNYFGKFVSS